MNIRKLLLLAVIPMAGVAANAQTDNTPQKGDITVGVSLGYSDYLSVSAYNTTYVSALNSEWNQKKFGLDFEFGYYTGDTWKLMFGAGLNLTGNPDEAGAGTSISDLYYYPTASETSLNYHLSAGFAKYYKTKVTNLMPYWGFRAGYAYAYNASLSDDVDSNGQMKAEGHNLRVAGHLGIDYFVAKGLYIGAQIDPVAYNFNTYYQKPNPDLERLKATSHNVSFLAQPTVKIGFKF